MHFFVEFVYHLSSFIVFIFFHYLATPQNIICDDKSGQGIGRCKTIIWKQLWRVYGSSTSDVDNLDDMRDRARTVLRWIEQEKMDERK